MTYIMLYVLLGCTGTELGQLSKHKYKDGKLSDWTTSVLDLFKIGRVYRNSCHTSQSQYDFFHFLLIYVNSFDHYDL